MMGILLDKSYGIYTIFFVVYSTNYHEKAVLESKYYHEKADCLIGVLNAPKTDHVVVTLSRKLCV